jgi:hypothetical protein
MASAAPYTIAHIDDIPTQPDEESATEWKPLRHYFHVGAFGVNLFRARNAGDPLTHVHSETDTGHEELFFVAQGEATFAVGSERVRAPAGTLVFVRDPSIERGAWANEPGTILLAVGGKPGEAYTVQQWEIDEFGD